MRRDLQVLIVVGLVAAVGIPAVLAAKGVTTGDPDAAGEHDDHAAGHTHQRARTTWARETGEVPAGPEGLEKVQRLVVEGSDGLNAEEIRALLKGSGTFADPYVLENLYVVRDLYLADTDQYFVIRNNFIGGQLTLNWNGDKTYVHHNYIRDLRVNENVPRYGDATGGWITENAIGYVGQIRHYDGVFSENKVGPMPKGPFEAAMDDTGKMIPWFEGRPVVNIDGFDGAVFENNDITGWVEMQLHGHHHASCFACHSHNHGMGKDKMAHDHSIRYHEGAFRDNLITVDSGLAFRYTDEGHAGDDRTANSEPEESLEGPHVHYTKVSIAGNKLVGGGLAVDVFNADDRYHKQENPGEISIADNEIQLVDAHKPTDTGMFDRTLRDGIRVREAKEMKLTVENNRISYTAQGSESPVQSILRQTPYAGEWLTPDRPAGIHVEWASVGDVLLANNVVDGFHYGVLAKGFDEVGWLLRGNVFSNVQQEIQTDETVES